MVDQHSIIVPSTADSTVNQMVDAIQQTTLIQRQAADPKASVWVSASAGTGKTKILTDRVLNLLLSGVAPRKILCLTYTKAAATEMNFRLLQRLSDWASFGIEKLTDELTKLIGYVPSKRLCARAQQLFIDVLNTPGGLNIQTIHSFCQSILRFFPTEANISPDFAVADTALSQQYLQQCLQNLFMAAQSDPVLKHHVDQVTLTIGLHGLMDKLQSLLTNPIGLRALQQQGIEAARSALYRDFGLDTISDPAAMITDYYHHLDQGQLQTCIDAWQQGGKEDQGRAVVLSQSLASVDYFKNNFISYRSIFLTQDQQIRSRLASQKAQAYNPQVLDLVESIAADVHHFNIQLNAQILAQQANTWMILALWIYNAYDTLKRQQGVLDYDDLLTYTFALLHQPGLAPFILYKLDGGIHHILVDEAQDTSPLQWALIAALTEEFFSGQGSMQQISTLFAVGDFKQSIYSFQGAEPQLFHEMRLGFAGKVAAANHDWHNLDMHVSFRSTPPILQMVDAVFADPIRAQGVADPSIQTIHHVSYRPDGGGIVELWPLVPQPQAQADDDFDVDDNHKSYSQQFLQPSPEERLAEVIARQIRGWLDHGVILESGRLLMAGDVLILVQRRNRFIYAMMRALKKQRIPAAGLDRLDVMEHIAVADLRALGRFLLLPYDDLSLAAVLKSPLFEFDDDQLLATCQRRQDGQSLWQGLRHGQDLTVHEAAAVQSLQALLKKVDFVSPFNLYADILQASGGLKKFLIRMGPTVQEVLEEFLTMAQSYESSSEASLQKFLDWCDGASSQIKRDLSTSALNEVRLMTVHGAKGLQAPVVIIADTTWTPDIQDPFIWSPQGYAIPNVAKDTDIQAVNDLKEAALQRIDEEYRRLLYVALTRAEERLYICGWETRRVRADTCWYNLCEHGLQSLGQTHHYNFTTNYRHGWQGAGLVYQQTSQAIIDVVRQPKVQLDDDIILPNFLQQPAPYEAPLKRPHTASHIDNRVENNTDGEFSSTQIMASTPQQQRGLYIHKLLEILPSQPIHTWPALATHLATEYTLSEDHDAYYQSVYDLLHDADYQHLFGPQSWPEVAMVGTIDGEPYSIQIDRLVIMPDKVIIVDFKSTLKPPSNVDHVPPAYINQLAIYRQLVQNLYPDRCIETYLLWTAIPRLMLMNP